MDGTYHINHIKKVSAHTPLGIVDKFDTYETALKNTLLNKFAIETPNNKLQEVTLQDGSKEIDYLPGTIANNCNLVLQTAGNWFSPLAMQDAFCLVCWFSCSFVSEACACFGEWL